jgi:hypothetical protein
MSDKNCLNCIHCSGINYGNIHIKKVCCYNPITENGFPEIKRTFLKCSKYEESKDIDDSDNKDYILV